MIQLTDNASTKVREIMSQQNPAPTALRVAVVGGGCSGFSYHMAFDNAENLGRRAAVRYSRSSVACSAGDSPANSKINLA